MALTTVNLIAQGTLTTLLGAELNGVVNNGFSALGAAFNNIFSGGSANFAGYILGDIKLNLAIYTGTPVAGSYIGVWFIPAIDGAAYDNSGTTISVGPDVIIPVDALASGPYQRTIRNIKLPCGLFKTIAQNNGTGITLAAASNTIMVRPTSYQSQ